ncbi:MAG: beta-ketoacyl synthase [Moraxellaceae bacterium]
MSRLPVVVGFGGINAAGRSSFHHGYRRLVLDALPADTQAHTLDDIAMLMGLDPAGEASARHEAARRHTLVRRIEAAYFDVDAMPVHHRLAFNGSGVSFRLRRRDLPQTLPAHWQVQEMGSDVEITLTGAQEWLLPDARPFPVTSAGQLPSGFDASRHYAARQHPRALQMAVFAASDALHSVGMDWEDIRRHVTPDRVAVYASSAHGQLDDAGAGGMLKAPWLGRRTSAKQCPLGFAEMPADFINAYVLGSTGPTAGILGACATFLYNMERAVTDIRDGRVDFALVGATEAPILPEVMEGYRAMGALGEDSALLALDRDKGLTAVDNRRATRPFGYNAGFTIAESAQFVVLTSDSLALQLGLPIHASVPGIFVHADGYKKSISAPGIGNYLTLAKAAGLARHLLGDAALRTQTYVQAHGTGTPQNRVTESHVFDRVAAAFGIEHWLIASVKCYVGHSLGAAAGDQFMAALGQWADGIVPGIFTLDEVAHDVHREHLRFSQVHVETGGEMAACFINSKGFGGNNATALLLGPAQTQHLLRQRHGAAALTRWQGAADASRARAAAHDARAHAGDYRVIYRFGEGVTHGHALAITERVLRLPGHENGVSLDFSASYSAYRENATPEKP